MEKYTRPRSRAASSHRQRRFEPLDMNKSSSSLNRSTSSLRSTDEKTRKDEGKVQQVTRRTTTVRFAPPSKPSSSTKTTSSSVSGQQATARPATASGPRPGPGSSAGPRCRTSAGRLSKAGPKVMRRSWGLPGAAMEERRNHPSTPNAQRVRSSSAPRRILAPEEHEKPSPKRSSKISTTTSRTKKNPGSPLKPDKAGSRSPADVAKKTGDEKAPNIVPLNNDTTKVSSHPSRITLAMIGAPWDTLPSDVQRLGLEVMRYRDGAEAAAVEALQEASAAEILLRCLSAFAELTSSAAAEQSPQQTVDEFLALHAALTSSTSAAVLADSKQDLPAGDWMRAAVASDLAPFSLYSPARISSRTSSPVSACQSPLPRGPGGPGAEERTWVDAARRVLVEEMRAWFLGHVERLLDGDVAGTLRQLKRVSDWLDAAGLESSEAVERVRKKIYGFLLDHVELAVVALNGGAAPGRRK